MPPINQRTLEKLSRAEIQRLATANGIKANLKTAHIITQLRRLSEIIAPRDDPSAPMATGRFIMFPEPTDMGGPAADPAAPAMAPPPPQLRRSRRIQASTNIGVAAPRIPTTIREGASSRKHGRTETNGELTEILGRASPALTLGQGEPVAAVAAQPTTNAQQMCWERAGQRTEQLRASHEEAASRAGPLTQQQHLDEEALERLRPRSRVPYVSEMMKRVTVDRWTRDVHVAEHGGAQAVRPQETAGERMERIERIGRRHEVYRRVRLNPRGDQLRKPGQMDIDNMGLDIQDVAAKFAGLEQLVRKEHAKTQRVAALLANLQSTLDAEGARRAQIVPVIQGFQPSRPLSCQATPSAPASQGGLKRRRNGDDSQKGEGCTKRHRGAADASPAARDIAKPSMYIQELDARLTILRRRVFDHSAPIQDYEGAPRGDAQAAGGSSHETPSDHLRRAPSPGSNRAAGLAHLLPKTPVPTPSPRVSKGKRRQRSDEDGDVPALHEPAGKRLRMETEPATTPAPGPGARSPDVPYKGKGKQREIQLRASSPEPSDEEPSDEEPESVAEARREVQAAVIRQLLREEPALLSYNLAYNWSSPQLQLEAAPVAGPSVPLDRGGGQEGREGTQ